MKNGEQRETVRARFASFFMAVKPLLPVCAANASFGANIREVQYAHGKSDFIAKLQIALKEANETGYWLELAQKTGYLPMDLYRKLDAQCTSLRAMLIASINTAKGNTP